MVTWLGSVFVRSRALNLLFDSGAQVTMCNKVVYNSMVPSCRPTLTGFGQPIDAANQGKVNL